MYRAEIDPDAPLVYTGQEVKPAIKFYDGNTLVNDISTTSDVSITYTDASGNHSAVNAGECIATIEGINNYKGTKVVPYEIVPYDLSSGWSSDNTGAVTVILESDADNHGTIADNNLVYYKNGTSRLPAGTNGVGPKIKQVNA